jgi:hypothetical protein
MGLRPQIMGLETSDPGFRTPETSRLRATNGLTYVQSHKELGPTLRACSEGHGQWTQLMTSLDPGSGDPGILISWV